MGTPGLRMLKGEGIDDTLTRIAKQEVGININPKNKILLGQYVGKFTTEKNRQDLSTGYLIKISDKNPIILNESHFSTYSISKQIPHKNIGAMYKYHLKNIIKRTTETTKK